MSPSYFASMHAAGLISAGCMRLATIHEPTVFDSDKVTKVERFICVALVILYALAPLQAVSINN